MILNRDDCQVLRGMAITCIFLHNYCHLLDGATHENEFWFSAEFNHDFWQNVCSGDAFVQIFSYFGHLGVPVFVFLTGYGLTLKYGNTKDEAPVSMTSFIWSHYKKFFKPILWGMLLYMLVYFLLNGSLWENWVGAFLTQLTLTNNLVLHPDKLIKPGPYWYFGMTMQLYLIYRIIVYRRSLLLFSCCLFLSIITLLFLCDHHYSLIWFKYNSVGWLLPFSLGLLMGRRNEPDLNRWQWLGVTIITVGFILAGAGNYYLWLLIPVFAVLFFVSICKLLNDSAYHFFHFLGNVSLYIFVFHPIVRELLLTLLPTPYQYPGIIIYIVIVILVASFFSWLSKKYKSVL